jgi:phospholipase A1
MFFSDHFFGSRQLRICSLLYWLMPLLILGMTLMPKTSLAEEDGSAPELIDLHHYKPIYFVAGNPFAKIEVSFKANLINSLPLYFGYSQLMMWDIFIHSPRFEDLNYNPEFFYRINMDLSKGQWIDLGFFEHESNGKGGLEERSWNRTYVRYHSYTKFENELKLHWDFKAWVPVSYNVLNRDLARYRGLWEANVTLSDFFPQTFSRSDLTLRFYPGGPSMLDPLRGGAELTLRAKLISSPVLPLFVAQVFHGYGENLSDYRYSHWGIRAGIGL